MVYPLSHPRRIALSVMALALTALAASPALAADQTK